MADQLDVTHKVLYDAFISLANVRLFAMPGDVKPYIVYYQPRLPLSYITIGREAYENRKELFVTKIGAMARYIWMTKCVASFCLWSILGRKKTSLAGYVMFVSGRKTVASGRAEKLEERILQVLAKQNTNIRELVRQLGEDEEVVIGQVRKLLDEGKISICFDLGTGVDGEILEVI